MVQREDNSHAVSGEKTDNLLSVKEKRRIFLLDTAEAVFLKKGYETATVRDILEEANLSKGGFYHYFKSKSDVLDALRTRYTRWFLGVVEAKVKPIPVGQTEKKFLVWINAYCEAYLSTVGLHDLVYHSVHTRKTNEDRVAITKHVEQLLREGVMQGIWTLSSPRLTAIIIYSSIHGVMDDAIARQDKNMPKIVKQLSTCLRLLLQ